jgi:hypothetical protein
MPTIKPQKYLLKILVQAKASFTNYLVGLLAIMVVVSLILKLITPNYPPTPSQQTPPPSFKPPSFEDLRPGEFFDDSASTAFGTLLKSEVVDNKTTHFYASEFKTKPNLVVVDENKKVIFVEENILVSQKKEFLSDFTQEFGEPSLELYNLDLGISVRSYVFLEKGVMVTAHIADGSVEQKWFFVPIAEADFLQQFETKLSKTYPNEP